MHWAKWFVNTRLLQPTDVRNFMVWSGPRNATWNIYWSFWTVIFWSNWFLGKTGYRKIYKVTKKRSQKFIPKGHLGTWTLLSAVLRQQKLSGPIWPPASQCHIWPVRSNFLLQLSITVTNLETSRKNYWPSPSQNDKPSPVLWTRNRTSRPSTAGQHTASVVLCTATQNGKPAQKDSSILRFGSAHGYNSWCLRI